MASTRVPMGFKFHLSDEEKMNYLLNKVTGSCCDVDFIGTVDLYGTKEPWDIFGDCEEKELYLFTELKKVGNKKSSQRISRNAGEGFWSNKGQKTSIYGRKAKKIIGYKRCFSYVSKKGGGADDDRNQKWLLKEYVLPDKVKHGVKEEYKDYALCVLKRKGSSGRNGGNIDVESGVEDMMEWINSTSTCQVQVPALPPPIDFPDKSAGDSNTPPISFTLEDKTEGEEWLLEQITSLDIGLNNMLEAAPIVNMDEDVRDCAREFQPACYYGENSSNIPNLVVIDDDHDTDDECSILETHDSAAAAPCFGGNTPNLVVIDDECSTLEIDNAAAPPNLVVIDDECSILETDNAAAAPSLEAIKGDTTFTEEFSFGFSLEDNAAPNDHFPWNDPFHDDYFPLPEFLICQPNFKSDDYTLISPEDMPAEPNFCSLNHLSAPIYV